MLNIYLGGGTTDREKFIFQNIKGRTLLLVPDQFSLQAERDAFFYLRERSLMDVRVVDFSSLGHKVVKQVGGRVPDLIDKYGRHMMLTRILGQCDEEMSIYRGMRGKNSFVEMLNGTISEMKRYGVTPEDLEKAVAGLADSSYLKYKIEDILTVYEKYQEQISGRYLDSEDYIDFYGEKILEAPMVREAEIWIYGFDTFTPKNMLIIERLIRASRGVNIALTYEEGSEISGLTKQVMGRLAAAAENAGDSMRQIAIDGMRRRTVWDAIAASGNREEGEDAPAEKAGRLRPLTLVEASNMYSEADRAAAYILRLVREEGLKFGDIAVVCNDTDVRGGIIRRTFTRWGIPVFMDRKRKVLHHRAVGFLLALMEIIAGGYRDEALMRLVKSGFVTENDDEAELLENYVKQFRIRGTAWKERFARGDGAYDDETLQRLDALRDTVTGIIERAKQRVGAYNTAGEKIRGLYDFLESDLEMMEKLKVIASSQEEAGFSESAAETSQSWNVICGIFDQIVDISGDEKVSNSELLKMMTAGLGEMEIGLVPVSPDCVMIGTLQRTRISRLRALLVVGANEGVLPLNRSDEGLLSDHEKAVLESMDLEVSKRDELVRQEERMALHRMIRLPEEYLYVSCCGVNESGEECRPSEVFSRLRMQFAKDLSIGESSDSVSFFGDLEDSGDFMDMITSKKGTLSYMASALRKYRDGEEMDGRWLHVLDWYREKDEDDIKSIRRGMNFDNRLEAMGDELADSLYRGDREALEVSASRLEQYSKCPFSHFIRYGLRAEEPRIYEVGAREIGDAYHRCLMKFSRMLTPAAGSGMSVDDEGSPWMTISEEDCRKTVRELLASDAADYREGLFVSGREEEYRAERISEICGNIAWAMVQQVRSGLVKDMRFEYPFGRDGAMPPVTVNVGGRQVYIQGKIDRLDVLEGDAVRIIDYKTGGDTIKPEHFREGYKLQLMVYLKAALDAAGPGNAEPAGVFYFKIKDIDDDGDAPAVTGKSRDLEKRMADAYRLEGIVLNDERLINAMDVNIEGASRVIPVKFSKKEGGYVSSAGGHLMTGEEFEELYEQVNGQVRRICDEICDGRIDISPGREREKDMNGNFRTACKYCGYRSICVFDTSFEGCGYRQV